MASGAAAECGAPPPQQHDVCAHQHLHCLSKRKQTAGGYQRRRPPNLAWRRVRRAVAVVAHSSTRPATSSRALGLVMFVLGGFRVGEGEGRRERAVLMALTLGAFMGACNLGRRRASWRVSYQPWARCYLPWSHQLNHLRTRMAASSELMGVSLSRSNGGLQAGRQGGRRTGARWCRATTWRISRPNDVALCLANRLNVTRLSDGQIHWAEG